MGGSTGKSKNPPFLSIHVDFFNGVRYIHLQGFINKRRFVMPSAQKTTRQIIKIPPPPPSLVKNKYLFYNSLEYSTDSLNATVSAYYRFRESFAQASIRFSIPFSSRTGLPLGVPADGDTRGNTAGTGAESLNQNTPRLKPPLSPRATAYRPRLMRINSANQYPLFTCG